jgi:hypothetical protein
MNRSTLAATSSLCALAAFAGLAHAQARHIGDIALEVRNQKLTAGFTDASGQINWNERAFAAVFGEFPNFTNDPGIDSGEGSLPPGSQIGFTILKALRKWDGNRFPLDASGIPAEQIQVRLGPLGPVRTPLTDSTVPGFAMAVSSLGQFHQHPGYTLLAPATNGIYLYEFELWSNIGTIEKTNTLWLVFSQNTPNAELDRAMDWVRQTFLCRADFNNDGTSDFFDYLDFVSAFDSENVSADFNNDGTVDFFDYLDFVAAFDVGCE